MKKKLLIIGNAPLPYENSNIRTAAGLRTYQFLKPITASGEFDIKTVCVSEDPDFSSTEYTIFQKNDASLLAKIQNAYEEFKPEIILAINNYSSFLASKLKSDAILWADLNGWWPAEAQAQANSMQSDDYGAHYHGMQDSILKRADKFSTVSIPQKHALYGELSSHGRLNSHTFGYEFVHHIPNGTEIFSGEEKYMDRLNQKHTGPENEQQFNLLWLGGYNNWVDGNTLFSALEIAMEKCPKLYFHSTGGKLSGLSSSIFDTFYEKTQKSKYKERYKFLGWVRTNEIPQIIRNSAAGLNVDIMCAETIFGARNRINEYMKFGLPVISTEGSEIADEVERAEAGLCAKSGDPIRLADKIVEMYKLWADKSEEYFSFGKRGQKYISEQCNFEKLSSEFLNWTKNAKHAADFGLKISHSGLMKAGFRYLRENGLRKFFAKLWQKLKFF